MSVSFEARRLPVEEPTPPWLKSYPACTRAHLDYPNQPVWGLLEHAARQFPQRIDVKY